MYEHHYERAAPMLDIAGQVAARVDSALSAAHWVAAVQAQVFASLGDLSSCQRVLDVAEQVHDLSGAVHNGGWLRFDGSRLAEERGTCYVRLRRTDLAEAVLTEALRPELSMRRRAGVLTDLALIGVQRRDLHQVLTYADAALDTARQTGSGYIGRRLRGLQTQLDPFRAVRQIRHLDDRINAVVGPEPS